MNITNPELSFGYCIFPDSAGFIHLREMLGKFLFFKVRELSGNSVMCQEKKEMLQK